MAYAGKLLRRGNREMSCRQLQQTSQLSRQTLATLTPILFLTFAFTVLGIGAEIAYYSHREGEWSWYIHIINTNGSEPIKLAEGGTPAWSPDGKRIAFSFGFNGFFGDVVGIYVVDANGDNRVKLTRNQNNRNLFPAWSPDGTKIAFWSHREGQPDIYLMNADGMNPINLTRDPHHEDRPTWSPDGKKIAFGALLVPRGEKGMSDIFVMDADGGNRINLTQNPEAVNQFPAWSPDGSRIAYEASPHPNHWFPPSNIYVMNADGSQSEMLTAGRRFASEGLPTWSPYGRRIAYHRREPDGKNDIFVINADGTGLLNLTKTEFVEELSPSWRPAPLAVSARGRLATKWGAVKLHRVSALQD